MGFGASNLVGPAVCFKARNGTSTLTTLYGVRFNALVHQE